MGVSFVSAQTGQESPARAWTLPAPEMSVRNQGKYLLKVKVSRPEATASERTTIAVTMTPLARLDTAIIAIKLRQTQWYSEDSRPGSQGPNRRENVCKSLGQGPLSHEGHKDSICSAGQKYYASQAAEVTSRTAKSATVPDSRGGLAAAPSPRPSRPCS